MKILLDSPWQTRKAAACCIQKIVATQHTLADQLLDILTDAVHSMVCHCYVLAHV